MIIILTLIGILFIYLIICDYLYINSDLRHVIKGDGLEYLQEAIDVSRPNTLDACILSIDGSTRLDALYITKVTPISFFFSYYVCCNDMQTHYGILRFSKAHYVVKRAMKEKAVQKTDRHIVFQTKH